MFRFPALFRTRPGRLILPAACGVFLLVEACAGSRGAENPFREGIGTETVILQVVNQNGYDAEIYLRPGTRRELLATIASGGFQIYEFQWPPGVPLSLELELSVGGRHRLPPLTFSGADRLQLTIAADLTRSTLRR